MTLLFGQLTMMLQQSQNETSNQMNTISNNMEKRMGGIQKIVTRLENRNNNTNGM
jgi:hypothetical protein